MRAPSIAAENVSATAFLIKPTISSHSLPPLKGSSSFLLGVNRNVFLGISLLGQKNNKSLLLST